jgi:hypothetical protein
MTHFLWVFFFVYGNKSSSVTKASGDAHTLTPHLPAFSKPLKNLKTLRE